MNIEQIDVTQLRPYEKNARIHTETQINQLVNSMKKWGWTIPILIDEENNILAGHGRYEAGKILEYDKVPCIRTNGWSEQQKKAYIIADNKLAENSSWDMGLYFNELKNLNDDGFDLSFIGVENWSSMEFSPMLEPQSNSSLVTESDFGVAENNISKQIDGASNQLHKDGIKVMCPKCAEEFIVSGY
jgi:ParB family chromosome partitioning protein